MAPLLEVNELVAGYGQTTVVRGLNLSLGAGEIVAVLGPNGAGKTTTLLTLSNLIPALGGTATVLGHDIRTTAPEKLALAGLAHVPEDRSLFTRLTVRDNLMLAAGKRKTVIDETLDMFPVLRQRIQQKAGALSGGEQQMLTIARALTQKPKILMIDEMSMGLAPLIVQELLGIVQRVAAETLTGILLVEQHFHLALSVAHRGLVLVHGRVTSEGTPSELTADGSIEAAYLHRAANATPEPIRTRDDGRLATTVLEQGDQT